ncbi:phosphate transport system regulatory protein PhoU [Marvinbryantia formatexigens DSM 14469]|uniref:Phosphate-specific transport system accessory protein PhoU n=2 Tax=Marvinbryantia TaxID=248744 RepID=C6LI66_9FIRM|nr:phosphate transport system regulatory protein PhoU [Marvinbryantia formatexigens DSM 14469]SDG46438.1 phosphate transport system protein [Marvinbryantia formatexigens]
MREVWLVMRNHYEEQLKKLNEYVAEMGELIEKAISDALDALMHKDIEEAKNTINYDNQIDHMEREIEGLCLNLLLSQQPVATDLRMVSAALKMVTDMERIGDHAADISEITLVLAKNGYPDSLAQIQKMAEETMKMVNKSVEAYLDEDMQKASEVIRQDDVVDNYFIQVKTDIIRQINENIQNGEQAADVLMIAKYLERIGDHATNIAEWVLFYLTGEHPDVAE